MMANQTPFDAFFFYKSLLGWYEIFYLTINRTKNSGLIRKQPKNKTKVIKQIKHPKNTETKKILEQNKSNTQKR